MPTYAAQSDIEDLFGKSNVAIWSNLEGESDVADTNRITKALNYADSYINNELRDSPWVMPTDSPNFEINDLASRLAGLWLYEARGHDAEDISDGDGELLNKMGWHRRYVDKRLKRIASGDLDIGLEREHTSPTGPIVCDPDDCDCGGG